jgi:predicted secreted protein
MKQIVLLLPVSFTYDGDAQLATTTITTQPANQIKHMEKISFTVLATNATSYQWQVNTGSGLQMSLMVVSTQM